MKAAAEKANDAAEAADAEVPLEVFLKTIGFRGLAGWDFPMPDTVHFVKATT